jgi:hypothetical protein
MPDSIDLTVDLGDPDSVRDKLVAVGNLVERMRASVAEAQTDLARWEATHDRLLQIAEALLGPAGMPQPQHDKSLLGVVEMFSQMTSVQTVESIVNGAGGPIRTADVRRRAPHLSPDTASWALWKASSTGLIDKLKRGLYAPKGFLAAQQAAGVRKAAATLALGGSATEE